MELVFHHLMEVMMLSALLPRTARFLLHSTAHNLRQSARALSRRRRPVFEASHTPEQLREFARVARDRTEIATVALALPVVRVEPDSNGIRLYLERPPAFEFEPGQFLTLEVSIDGVNYRRQYSIFTAPTERDHLGLAIRRVQAGVVSNHIADTACAGDTVHADGPSGRFTLSAAEGSGNVVLIAGGVGITPLMSIGHAAALANRGVHLFYANRGVRSTMLADRVGELDQFPGVSVTHVLERAAKSRPSEVGRFDSAMMAKLLSVETNSDYFVCGPAAMMDAITEYLSQQGVPDERVHTERFAQAKTSTAPSTRTHAVRFAKSGRLVNIPEGQTILEGAQAAGINLAFSCTMGGCAACKVRCEGDVHLPAPNCLTSDEAAAGETLACIACPRSALTIDA